MSSNRARTRGGGAALHLRPTWALALALAALGAGCASLPPASPIASVKELAGQWEGEVATRNGTHSFRTTIDEDGSSLSIVPTLAPGTFRGRYDVEKGAIRFVSLTTGRGASCTLHPDGERRVLACRADDGATASTSRSVR